jgi:cytidylate kinase
MRIVLTGQMGSGKSHIAGLLVPLGYTRLHFATPLKQAALCFQDKPGRELLQKLSEVSRGVEPPPLLERMEEALEFAGDDVVIDDCRFKDELAMLRANDFKAVRITAPISLRVERLKENGRFQNLEQLSHASENGLQGVDLPVLENVGLSDEDLINDLWGVVR